jgi:hypothetical protein
MKRGLVLVLAVFLTLALVTPGLAAMVVITAAAPLENDSAEAVQAALDEAVGQAVDDAMQFGLRPVQLRSAEVWSDRVVVEVVAIDAARDDDVEAVRMTLPDLG